MKIVLCWSLACTCDPNMQQVGVKTATNKKRVKQTWSWEPNDWDFQIPNVWDFKIPKSWDFQVPNVATTGVSKPLTVQITNRIFSVLQGNNILDPIFCQLQ